MKWCFSRRVFAAVLGVFLAAGMVLPLTQVADAAITPTVGDMQPVPCSDCGGDFNDMTAGAMDCVPVCIAPALMASGFGSIRAMPSGDLVLRPSPTIPPGRMSSPDPHPPKLPS